MPLRMAGKNTSFRFEWLSSIAGFVRDVWRYFTSRISMHKTSDTNLQNFILKHFRVVLGSN